MAVQVCHREAEAAVVGLVALRGQVGFDLIADKVAPDDFDDPGYRSVFEAACALVRRGLPIDVVTLFDELRANGVERLIGGLAGLSKLGDDFSAHVNYEHHATRVRELGDARRFLTTCRLLQDEAEEATRAPARWLDSAEGRLIEASRRDLGESLQTGAELIDAYRGRCEDRARGVRALVVSTGFADLDKIFGGGMKPGQVIIVAGRPSMGKTAFSLQLALNAAIRQREPVLIFSLEQPREDLCDRLLACEAQVALEAVDGSRPMTWDEANAINAAAERIADAPLLVDDASSATTMQMRARARRWRADRKVFPEGSTKIGLVIVDYVQLVEPEDAATREQEVAMISRHFKGLARSLKMPLLLLAQLNRGVGRRLTAPAGGRR